MDQLSSHRTLRFGQRTSEENILPGWAWSQRWDGCRLVGAEKISVIFSDSTTIYLFFYTAWKWQRRCVGKYEKRKTLPRRPITLLVPPFCIFVRRNKRFQKHSVNTLGWCTLIILYSLWFSDIFKASTCDRINWPTRSSSLGWTKTKCSNNVSWH